MDADHIRLETVDRFLPHSDFFTIDVADSIGKPCRLSVAGISPAAPRARRRTDRPGYGKALPGHGGELERIAAKYLLAIREAGQIYRHIRDAKGEGNFITEVSMDETETPQTPPELLVILAALADEQVPLQTIAPKFTGRFNKGVDYVGRRGQFEQEFNDDLAVIAFAVKTVRLARQFETERAFRQRQVLDLCTDPSRPRAESERGLHLKTAGTTWLEEVIGLAEAGGEGLALAKEIYAGALEHGMNCARLTPR